mmetsp:Transcript_115755/g.323720  ORF Transcript_115755/g.323720 Transcript_115755/m.323720 type:complete len:372 (+) Transcript_115755:107-1222(+)
MDKCPPLMSVGRRSTFENKEHAHEGGHARCRARPGRGQRWPPPPNLLPLRPGVLLGPPLLRGHDLGLRGRDLGLSCVPLLRGHQSIEAQQQQRAGDELRPRQAKSRGVARRGDCVVHPTGEGWPEGHGPAPCGVDEAGGLRQCLDASELLDGRGDQGHKGPRREAEEGPRAEERLVGPHEGRPEVRRAHCRGDQREDADALPALVREPAHGDATAQQTDADGAHQRRQLALRHTTALRVLDEVHRQHGPPQASDAASEHHQQQRAAPQQRHVVAVRPEIWNALPPAAGVAQAGRPAERRDDARQRRDAAREAAEGGLPAEVPDERGEAGSQAQRADAGTRGGEARGQGAPAGEPPLHHQDAGLPDPGAREP